MVAEVELEASRWAEIMALVELLTPEERAAPGYFRDPDWTVKDLVAHLGSWQAEARSELLKIATRMYEPHDFEIDRRNAETLAARKTEPWDLVWSRATAGRAWMLEAWLGLRAIERGEPVGPQGGRRALWRAPRSPSSVDGRAHRPADASAGRRARPVRTRVGE